MSSANSARFILVGHCGPDMYMLRSAVSRIIQGALTAIANDDQALRRELEHAPGSSVLLINRLLDGGFDAQSGVELIRQLSDAPLPPTMMLISNFPEAQKEAIAAGALPGFGKAELYNSRTAELLRDAVASNSTR